MTMEQKQNKIINFNDRIELVVLNITICLKKIIIFA